MPRKTRKMRKKKGGNPSPQIQELQKYVTQMKNGESIDVATFKQYLDSIPSPLTIEFSIEGGEGDGNAGQHTINEWAIIYDCHIKIHSIFEYYEVLLTRRISYPYNIFYSNNAYNILEAYILYGKSTINVNAIIEQIGNNKQAIDDIFFYMYPTSDFPTVLQYAVETSNYKNLQMNDNIYSLILNTYVKKYLFDKLTNNRDIKYYIKLFNYAITNIKMDLMIIIAERCLSIELIQYLLHPTIIEKIMLIDNEKLYRICIEILNTTNEKIIIDILNNYINHKHGNQHTISSLTEYIKGNSLDTNLARKFFKKVAQHTIDHLLIPSISKTPKIIIICHGSSFGRQEATYQFPFKKLCFFVGKGNKLLDECIVSKHVEELICAGNYDKRVQCTEGTNGEIAIENMLFKFIPTTLDHARNNTLGIYTCMNRKVEKKEFDLNEPYYTMNTLIGLCSNICMEMDILQEYVEIMMFVCRGYENEEEIQEQIKAVPAISPESA